MLDAWLMAKVGGQTPNQGMLLMSSYFFEVDSDICQ
jgi:hypothetical protein